MIKRKTLPDDGAIDFLSLLASPVGTKLRPGRLSQKQGRWVGQYLALFVSGLPYKERRVGR